MIWLYFKKESVMQVLEHAQVNELFINRMCRIIIIF